MEHSTSINAAGDFLRALKDREGRPGGQGLADAAPLPVSAVLRLVLEHGRGPVADVKLALAVDDARFIETLKNLRDLGLITLESRDGHDVVSLTDTGEVVARRQRDG